MGVEVVILTFIFFIYTAAAKSLGAAVIARSNLKAPLKRALWEL